MFVWSGIQTKLLKLAAKQKKMGTSVSMLWVSIKMWTHLDAGNAHVS